MEGPTYQFFKEEKITAMFIGSIILLYSDLPIIYMYKPYYNNLP